MDKCTKCDIHETSYAGKDGEFPLNCMQGAGPIDANIMIVGTVPTKYECKKGYPLADNAGDKLDECLEKAGLSREEVRITYLVRCKTPDVEKTKGNPKARDPKVKEVRECKEHLIAEINEVKPNVIIMLGNIVSKHMIGKTGVNSIHGTPYWSDAFNATCIPVRNPSALLGTYSKPQDEINLINDLKFAKESSLVNDFQPKEKIKTNYVTCDTVAKVNGLIKRLNTLDEYVFDIETTGLNPDNSDLLGISFSWKEGTACYLPFNNWFKYYTEEDLEIKDDRFHKQVEIIETYVEEGKKQKKKRRIGTMVYKLQRAWSTLEEMEEFIPFLKGVLATKDIRKIGHNIAFDVCYLNRKLNIDIENATYCTMLAQYLPDPDRPERKLEELAWLLTDMGGYDGGLKGEREISFINTPKEELSHYGSADSDCTYRIYQKQKEDIKNHVDLLEKIVVPLAISIREMEYNGVMIDLDKVNKLSDKFQKKIDAAEEKLYALKDVKAYIKEFEGKQHEELKLEHMHSKTLQRRYLKRIDYINKKIKPFNFGSTTHLRALLKYLGITIQKKTATGLDSTDEETLLSLKGKHKVINHMLELRHLKKIHSTYLKPIPEKAAYDGRLHSSYRLDKTATGRLASSKPNLQNIPKKKDGNDIRDTFIASDGNIMVECDLKQIEYRILAHFVNDKKMIKDIEDGLDIHRLIASEIYNITQDEVTSEQRSISKTATFGVPYGRSAKSLSAEFNMPIDEAEEFRNSLLLRYPRVKSWIDKMINGAREHGYVKTFFGRIRYLPKMNDNDFGTREAEERKVVATCIQGTASDILSIYTNNIRNKLKEMKSKTKMVLTVHDALFFDIPKEESKEIIKMIQTEMQRPITWKGKTIRVPIETDTQVGTSWGSLVDYEEKEIANV